MSQLTKKIAAWGVHVFTSLGLLTAFLALIAIGNSQWQMAFFWLFISFIIDGLDGTLARYFKVREVLPGMDGKNIDYVIDFASYALIPAYFFYKAEMVAPAWMYPCLALILLSSALYYGKEGMVEEEQYFVGFPVLWNLVVFYGFFVFHNYPELNVLMVVVFSILHFVPIKFAYPSRSKKYLVLHIICSILFFVGAAACLYYYPKQILALDIGLTAIVLYFAVIATLDTWLKPSGTSRR